MDNLFSTTLKGDFFMEQLFQFVTSYIEIWGYPAILIGMALESANIPIPSELIFGFAGYLVFRGQLDLNLAIFYGILGGLLGSAVSYYIGYYGGPRFVYKYGKYVLLSERKIRLAQDWFDKYGLFAVFFARLLPVVRTFISLPAGFAKVNFPKFMLYTLLGSTPWTIAIIYAGMALGENWHILRDYGHEASLLTVAIIFGIVIYYVRKNRSKRQREQE
jgi:membrane protein DedA with SNARE-associated domain